jgi:hypothetical protein
LASELSGFTITAEMKNDIIRKLQAELGEPISSERQVVYILVELRKLLEQEETLTNFKTLKLCCDWAVHPRLDRTPAQEIIQYFDGYEKEYRRSGIGVQQYNLAPMLDFLEHRKFRSELITACHNNGIGTDLFSDDRSWRSFVLHYTAVIEDCPFEAKADNTEFVTKVTAQVVSQPLSEVIMPGKSGIQWTWETKGKNSPNSVMSFF